MFIRAYLQPASQPTAGDTGGGWPQLLAYGNYTRSSLDFTDALEAILGAPQPAQAVVLVSLEQQNAVFIPAFRSAQASASAIHSATTHPPARAGHFAHPPTIAFIFMKCWW